MTSLTKWEVCQKLITNGWEIGVITWLPPGTEEYTSKIAQEKKDWIARFMPIVTEMHIQQYQTPKHKVVTTIRGRMIPVDDNAEIRKAWTTKTQRIAIDATNNMIDELKKLLDT